MPIKLDGVLQTTTSTGTGDLSLDGSSASYRTFTQAVAAGDMAWGDVIYYVVQDGTNREWGYAQILESGVTLKRTTGTRLGSTNAGAAISVAGGGVTQVFSAIPDEVKLIAQDRKSVSGTLAETDVNNNFSTSQTITGVLTVTGSIALTGDMALTGDLAVNGGNLTLTKTDDGATGAEFESYHNTASAAVSDKVWQHTISAKNASGTKKTAADWYTEWLDATNASEDARTKFRAMVAGTLTEIIGFGSDGVTIGSGATPQGIGTLNVATAFYIGGVLQTAQTRQAFYVEQSSTTNSAVSGANKLNLGTPAYNTISGATWDGSADEVTLPAGTYHVQASIDVLEETSYGGGAQFRVRDVTNSVTLADGQNMVAQSTNVAAGQTIYRDFTLAGSAAIRLEISFASGSHTYTTRNQKLEIVKVG